MSERQEMLRKEYEERRARYVKGKPDGKSPGGGGGGAGVGGKGPPRWPWAVAAAAVLVLAAAAACLLRGGDGPGATGGGLVKARLEDGTGASLTEEEASKLVEFFRPAESEMEQIYQFIVTSPHIRDNELYAAAMEGVPLLYQEDENEVNAVARRQQVETEEGTAEAWSILLYGGLVRYSRLLGLAAAEEKRREGTLQRTVDDMPRSLLGNATLENTAAFAAREGLAEAVSDETTRRFAKDFSSGMIMGVLAHETGHHALGHLMGTGKPADEGIQRDQELQADLFASSITKASPIGNETMLVGQLLFHYAMAMQTGEEEGDRNTGDHPLSRWRFETFVRQNEELAASVGIVLL